MNKRGQAVTPPRRGGKFMAAVITTIIILILVFVLTGGAFFDKFRMIALVIVVFVGSLIFFYAAPGKKGKWFIFFVLAFAILLSETSVFAWSWVASIGKFVQIGVNLAILTMGIYFVIQGGIHRFFGIFIIVFAVIGFNTMTLFRGSIFSFIPALDRIVMGITNSFGIGVGGNVRIIILFIILLYFVFLRKEKAFATFGSSS